jgi:hypothetical protein
MFGCDVETGIGALQPAQGTLDAFIEIDHRPHRPRGVFLEVLIAFRLIAAFLASEPLAYSDPLDHDGVLHFPILRLLKILDWRRIPLIWSYAAGYRSIKGLLRRRYFQVIIPLLHDCLFQRFHTEELRGDARQRAQHPHLGMILLIDPETREAGWPLDNGQVILVGLAVNPLQQGVGRVDGGDEQQAICMQQFIDWLGAIPGPGFHPFTERIIHRDRNIDDRGLVPRHADLQFKLIVGDDGELFGGDAITFWRIAIASEGDTDFAFFARGQHDASTDALAQILLKNAAIHDFYRHCTHGCPPSSRRGTITDSGGAGA